MSTLSGTIREAIHDVVAELEGVTADFSTSKLRILYLHNTIIHRFYPPNNLHRHCFRFPLGHLHVPGEIANNDYANFWGVKEVYYGICASREWRRTWRSVYEVGARYTKSLVSLELRHKEHINDPYSLHNNTTDLTQ